MAPLLSPNTVFVVRYAHPNFALQNLTNTDTDSQVSEQRKNMFSSLFVAKRHFGYLADERLKPKCPFVTLRSSATPLSEMAIK